MGRSVARASSPAQPTVQHQEFEGVVRGGKVELVSGTLPEGTRVQLRVKK
jgi:hypothetical protein